MEISSTKYHVGMPPVRPLPLENSHDVIDVCSPDVLDELYEKVADILHAQDISLTKPSNAVYADLIDDWSPSSEDETSEDKDYIERPISLVYRSYPDIPESARLTLLIIAPWTTSPEAWELALQTIRPLVLEYLRTQQEVDVEMIDKYHFDSLSLSPVGDNPEFTRNWDGIRAQIVDVLKSNPASQGAMVTVMCFRAGRTKSSDDPIAVYVCVSDDCAQADWPPIIADIKEIIDPHHLELIFEHNVWKLDQYFDY
ncbi:unnamed protein product [Clonostachys chloroleuca]|uniref:Uncharacterized protein n=1 Tax=Clonostachys chloroleuca TaxID=1926264 RepID=A0AA35QES3_9HYPO|nr:unnamed protein product [Clonostachys chloroleuca]